MVRDYDRDDREDELRPRDPNEARRKVNAPAILLIVTGIIGLLLSVLSVVSAYANPYGVYDFQKQFMVDSQPDSKQKEELQKQLEAQKEEMRSDKPLNIAIYAVGFVLNVLTVVGGFKMRGLSGYGLSMVGTITAILPLGGCCCLTMPIGIWSLIVLLNPGVKQAFGVGRAEPADDDRDRDDDRR